MDALAGKVAATFQAQNESRDRAWTRGMKQKNRALVAAAWIYPIN
jgi:hypothetical protein